MKKIIITILTLFILTSCGNEYKHEWSICIDNDNISFDSWNMSNLVQSKIDVDYEGRDCKMGKNGSTDIISCFGDAFYSINCKGE